MSKLYIVPTPIGNLEDITLRAIRILKEVDGILAEDTRKTRALLDKYDIHTPLFAYHQHNEHNITERISERLAGGETLAIVTDAGTPGISDPGFMLVRRCIAKNIDIECIPGATAFVPALVDSGIPFNTFCFEGFLPHKKGRNKKLESLRSETRTMVFYESPFRLVKTLEQFKDYFGADRKAAVSRELTKIYEETIRGSLEELLNHFSLTSVKGELVIVLSGKEPSTN